MTILLVICSDGPVRPLQPAASRLPVDNSGRRDRRIPASSGPASHLAHISVSASRTTLHSRSHTSATPPSSPPLFSSIHNNAHHNSAHEPHHQEPATATATNRLTITKRTHHGFWQPLRDEVVQRGPRGPLRRPRRRPGQARLQRGRPQGGHPG